MLTSVLHSFVLFHQAATIDVLSESGVKVEPLVSSRVNFHSLSQQFEDGYVYMSNFTTCADPEGGQGVRNPMKITKYRGS